MRQGPLFLLAVLSIALAAGCAKRADDTAIVANIKSQMFSDQQVKNASVQVTSDKGQVTLSGTVPSDAVRYDAYKIATQTAGVLKVNDQMVVQSTQVTEPPAPPAPTETREPAHKSRASKKVAHTSLTESESASNIPPSEPPAPVDQPASVPPPPAQPPLPPVPAPPVPPPPPPPPQTKEVTIPASATITIRMIDPIDSAVNKAGEIFHASLEAPIVVDTQVVVPKGVDVYVRLANASSAGRMTGKSELHLELIKLEFQGQSYPLVSSTYSLTGSSQGKGTAEKVGGGAVLGALIGAIAGGGKGAAIGAGVGAGAGGVYQGTTKGKQVKIASETKLDFQLDQPVTITVMPRSTDAQ